MLLQLSFASHLHGIFFHPLTFSLCVSWGLKWVSCRQHIYGSCFWIHSTSLCLFVGAFNPFTLNYWYICSYCHFLNCLGLIFCIFFSLLLYFLTIQVSLTFIVNLVWWNWILLTFACLKSFFSSINLNEILDRYSNLGCRLFPFSTLNIPCQSLLACRVSAERSAVKRIAFPLYGTCCY